MNDQQILRAIEESDIPEKEELIVEIYEASNLKVEKNIQRNLAEACTALHGALQSREQRRISAAVRELRKIIGLVTGKSSSKDNKESIGISRLPSPPQLTSKMAAAFLRACGGKLISADRTYRIFTVDGQKYEDAPKRLLRCVGTKIFSNENAFILSIRYVEFLAEGKTAAEAESLAKAEAVKRAETGPKYPPLPTPPELTSEMAKAFLHACGGKLGIKDTLPRTVNIGNKQYQDSPGAFMQRIGSNVFGSKFTSVKIIVTYVTLLSQGKRHKDAEKGALQSNHPTLPDAADLTPQIATAFLNACGGKLDSKDAKAKLIVVEKQSYEDSPQNFIKRIAYQLFDRKIFTAIRYILLLAEGKTPDDAELLAEAAAIKKVESAPKFPPLPSFPPELTPKMASIFLETCGGKLISDDTKRRVITVGKEKFEDAPRPFLQRVSRQCFQEKNAFSLSARYLTFYAQGKNHEEAKRLAFRGEEPSEEDILHQINELQITELFSIFSDRPGQLKLYLLANHPKLTEEEINKLIIRGFKSFFGGSRNKDAEYQDYSEILPPIILSDDLPTETEDPVLTISGTAPQAEMVYIGGICSRRCKVAADGSFTIQVPLQIGHMNNIHLTSVDTKNQTRNFPLILKVDQIGSVDPLEELISRLSDMGKEAIAAIQVDPGKYEYLKSRCMHMLLRKFSKDFHHGEQYMRSLIDSNRSKVIKKMLNEIFKEFERINVREFANILPERPLYFFQKFAADRIEQKILSNAKGFILAGEAGLGKTCIALAAVNGEDAVVVSPNSVVSGWSEEVAKCMKNPDFFVMQDMPHAERKEKLKTEKARHRITNIQFLQKHEDDERFDLLMNEDAVLVHDEAHTRANLGSDQTKGMLKLAKRAKFQLLISATIFKHPKSVRRVFHTLYPDREEFKSDAAFTKAFPSDDPDALKTLNLMIENDILRLTKHDVLEEMDLKISIKKQLHKLPRKDLVPPNTMGTFEMHEEQAEVIYEMMLDWKKWTKKYGHYIPKDEVAKLDHLRYGDALSKRHAYRQVVNDPAFVGLKNLPNRKALLVQKIVQQSLSEGRKVEIFSVYNRQTQIYANILNESHPALYTGITSKEGWKRNVKGRPILYRKDERGRWVFGKDGYPIENSESGEPMLAMDYERLTFQNAPERKVVLSTYAAGAVGTTFTAAKTVIKDDLPRDCIEDEQADDRTHRIDHEHQTHHTVKYFHLISTYPQSFLEKMKKKWVVKQDNDTYKEYSTAASALKDRCNEKGKPAKTAYETFFEQGTWDQVHYGNLQVQRRMMHLILDGVADESELKKDDAAFVGLKNGNQVEEELGDED